MNLCSSENCYSCMACVNVCPFDAVDIKTNIYGAIQPVVNEKKCKTCGLCQKVCVVKNAPKFHYPRKTIALYAKSSYDKKTCASGGAATSFGRYVISQGGCVFGATSFGGYPKYIKVEDEYNLDLLKGSKYVYCDPSLIYIEVKKELEIGRTCLFIGTPCFVAALQEYLNNDYKNLITIDLVCHGTPPFSYLQDHLKSQIGDYSKVENFSFRGQNDFFLTVYDKNGKIIYKRSQYEDEYFISFMKGVMFRPICYNCQFAQSKRVSDITIGDFWNVGKDALDGYRGKISVSLLNTEKGEIVFSSCNQYFTSEEREVKEAINGNDQLRYPSKISEKSLLFSKTYVESSSLQKCYRVIGIYKSSYINRARRYVLFIPKFIRKILTNI